jgi:hypothetical protein
MAYELNTNLVRKVQILFPVGQASDAEQVSEVKPLPTMVAFAVPVIPLNTNLVRWCQVVYPGPNGEMVQVSEANPLPVQSL